MSHSYFTSLLFRSMLVLLAVVSGLLAFQAATYYEQTHDGYLFILQSRRLVDTRYSDQAIMEIRPRALVAVLNTFDRVVHIVSGEFPTMALYGILMGMIAMLSVLAWWTMLRKSLGEMPASLAAILLMLNTTFLGFSLQALSDILAGLFIALFFIQLSKLKDSTTLRPAIGLGIFASLVSLSKHQTLLLPFLAVAVWLWVLYRRGQFSRVIYVRCLVAFLSCFIASDLICRIWGNPWQGMLHNFRFVMGAAFESASGAQYTTAEPAIYALDLYRNSGFLLSVLLFVGSIGAAIRLRRKDNSPELLSLLCCVLFVTASLHKFQIRETRYLLAVLPGIYAFCIWGLPEISERYSGWKRHLFTVFVACAMIFPLKLFFKTEILSGGSHRAKRNQARSSNFYEFITGAKTDRELGLRCKSVFWCDVAGLNYQFELPRLVLDSQLRVLPEVCPTNPKDYASQRNYLFPEVQPGFCYMLHGLGPQSGALVIQQALSGHAARQFGRGLPENEFLDCSDPKFCFYSKAFSFNGNP